MQSKKIWANKNPPKIKRHVEVQVNSWNQDFEQKRLDGLSESSGPAMVITCWKVTIYHTDGREGWLKGDAMPYLMLDWARGLIYRASSRCQVRSKALKYDGAPGGNQTFWTRSCSLTQQDDLVVERKDLQGNWGHQSRIQANKEHFRNPDNKWLGSGESESETKSIWAPGIVPRQTPRTLLHEN